MKRKVEPSAANRVMARTTFEMFTAFLDEGFTEDQALVLIGQMMKNALELGEDEEE